MLKFHCVLPSNTAGQISASARGQMPLPRYYTARSQEDVPTREEEVEYMRKLSLGMWRLIAIGVVIVALVLAGAVLLTTKGSGTVHASGTGGGCPPSSTPVCTFQGLAARAEFTST